MSLKDTPSFGKSGIVLITLSNFDLLDSKEGIFRSLELDETIVNNMIMKAREKWFTEKKET